MTTTELRGPLHPRAPAWAVDLLLAVLVVGPAFAPFLSPGLSPDSILLWVIALAPAAILPLRRRFPFGVLVALMVLLAIAATQGALLPGIGLAIVAAVFHIANTTNRRVSLIVCGVTILVVTAASLVAAIAHGVDPAIIQSVVTVAFASAAGDATRSRREYLIAVTERAERAEQTRESEASRRVAEERLRIARDLHDAVAHQISVISLNAGVASSSLDSNPERTRAALLTIRQASRTVLREIGDLLGILRTAEQDDDVAAPQYDLEHLDSLLEQFAAGGLDVHRRVEGDPSRVTGAVGLVAYRVIQETLTNAHKHGTEHRAHLFVDVGDDVLRIVVTNPSDPASALDAEHPDEPLSGNGLGLLGLRERVASVRGTVDAGPAPGGWKVTTVLPLPKEPTA